MLRFIQSVVARSRSCRHASSRWTACATAPLHAWRRVSAGAGASGAKLRAGRVGSRSTAHTLPLLSLARCAANDVLWTRGGRPDDITIITARASLYEATTVEPATAGAAAGGAGAAPARLA